MRSKCTTVALLTLARATVQRIEHAICSNCRTVARNGPCMAGYGRVWLVMAGYVRVWPGINVGRPECKPVAVHSVESCDAHSACYYYSSLKPDLKGPERNPSDCAGEAEGRPTGPRTFELLMIRMLLLLLLLPLLLLLLLQLLLPLLLPLLPPQRISGRARARACRSILGPPGPTWAYQQE